MSIMIRHILGETCVSVDLVLDEQPGANSKVVTTKILEKNRFILGGW